MGSCESKELAEQKKASKNIDRALERVAAYTVQKLLLLGPGESGKSTCLKQMQILHQDGFSKEEIKEKRRIVYVNIVSFMSIILRAAEERHYFIEPDLDSARELVHRAAALREIEEIPPNLQLGLQKLWKDKNVLKIYETRGEYHLSDSAAYFFDNLDRICEKGYQPSHEDILHTRVPTTGVVQMSFKAKGLNFEVYDVVAISEYDQLLKEDDRTNRLLEALELYDSVVNARFFLKTGIILFLNKKDLFAEKIKSTSLKVCFAAYKGENNYNDGVAYIKRQFDKLDRRVLQADAATRGKQVYIHETCATDTSQVQVVIRSVIDTIIQENLRDTGML
ncbi:unnamed protein product, partial [Mesorhabditis spiculigera]